MKITLWVSQSNLAPIKIHNHHVEIPNEFLEFLQCPTNTVSRPFECDSTSLSRYSASQTTKPFNQPSWFLAPLGQSVGEIITIQMHVKRLPLCPRTTWQWTPKVSTRFGFDDAVKDFDSFITFDIQMILRTSYDMNSEIFANFSHHGIEEVQNSIRVPCPGSPGRWGSGIATSALLSLKSLNSLAILWDMDW